MVFSDWPFKSPLKASLLARRAFALCGYQIVAPELRDSSQKLSFVGNVLPKHFTYLSFSLSEGSSTCVFVVHCFASLFKSLSNDMYIIIVKSFRELLWSRMGEKLEVDPKTKDEGLTCLDRTDILLRCCNCFINMYS